MSQTSFILHAWKERGVNNNIDSSATIASLSEQSKWSRISSRGGSEAALPWLNLQFLMNLKGRLALTLNGASCIFKRFATKHLTTQKGGWYGKTENSGNKWNRKRQLLLWSLHCAASYFYIYCTSSVWGTEGSDSAVAASLTCWITLGKSLSTYVLYKD